MRSDPRVGYVLKMYPRFSETFIVNELLAIEAAGTDVEVFSLRPPADGRFHESLAAVRAPVSYLTVPAQLEQLWSVLQQTQPLLPGLAGCLDELLQVEAVDAAQALQLAVAVRERGITHLHAHFGSVATTVARLAARLTGLAYTFTAHAKDIFHESVDPADLRRKLADAAGAVTVSDFNLRYLRSRYGDATARLVRLYNGLDLRQFRYSEPRCRPQVVVAVGRLVEKKGFSDLLGAVALLVQAGRPLRLDVVGTGPLATQLHRQAADLGLSASVRFHGALPQGEVRRIVQDAAVFAAPCVIGADGNRDGLPTVLLEAMALGTACVSTPVTGIPEAIRHEQTGLLVPEHDAPALAGALERLLDDASLRVRLAQAARALVEAEFDVDRQAAQLRELFGMPVQPPSGLALVGSGTG